jgi:hypothetical protein
VSVVLYREIIDPDPVTSSEFARKVARTSRSSPLGGTVLDVDANRDRGAIMTAISPGKKEVPN